MKKTSLIAAGAGLLFAVHAAAQTKWDMPTPYPATNFHTENIARFAADIDKATGGKLKITVHANQSLFKTPEIKRAIQGGQAQIGEVLLSALTNEDPVFGVDNVPFLATSYADARRLWQASKSAIEARFARQGMKLLYAVPWPPQGIYTKKAVGSAADLKGEKIRSYSPQTARLIELLGAQPVTVQAAELAQALATGVVNANITSGATGYDSKSWEQLSHFYDVQAWLPKNVVFVNAKAFDSLDKGAQQAVLQAAAAAETRGWKVSEEKAKWYLEQLAAKGMKVEPPSPALRADLRRIGETMTADWLKSAGADGQAIVAAYRK
ncbi:MAG: TRAP transporter substrate-binding protein [Rhodocyclaceae bacterium]